MLDEKEPYLHIDHVTKRFEIETGSVVALNDVNLRVRSGEIVSIVGASGCGKSTLLKLIVGLSTCTEGKILCAGQPINRASVGRGMVFQESRLLPWKTVEQNIAYGIPSSIPGKQRRSLIQRHIQLVGLQGFEKALPHQLSGGMQQRVSIARALVRRPEILLLDEPFGALDALTRIQMQQEVLRIWDTERNTMILVTHDIDEAIYLGDRVIVMSSRPGTIKSVFNIDLPRPRDRGCYEFTVYRRRILREFFEEHTPVMSYEI
ncbi:MAG: ABC transporter ATP-binding protein [Fibrobacter sp.]|nr:ABC transporter ATP-binding protein [Fibrobacter sp.]